MQLSPNKTFLEEHGKTTDLLLRLTKFIHHSGRVVIMDSGFCVLLALVKMASFGLYSSAAIKKRQQYWPKYKNGSDIDTHFNFKEVLGLTDSLPGTLECAEFKVFYMKEKDYVMILMAATYGAL
jgi:Transposase IS4